MTISKIPVKLIPPPIEPIKVLLLCSYDKETLKYVESLITELKEIYDPHFEGRIMLVIAKNVEILEARSQKERYLLFVEKFGETWEITISKNGEIVESIWYFEGKLDEIINRIKDSIKGLGEYKEVMTITKVMELCKWADLISVVKEKGLGRGGELIELCMIVCAYLFKNDHIINKVILLRKNRVKVSWMLREMVQLGHIREKTYRNFDQLLSEFKSEIDLVIEKKKLGH